MSKQCENCSKFNFCWFPHPEPFGYYQTQFAQDCIKEGYSKWSVQSKEQQDKKGERNLVLLILLLMAVFIIGVTALLSIVT